MKRILFLLLYLQLGDLPHPHWSQTLHYLLSSEDSLASHHRFPHPFIQVRKTIVAQANDNLEGAPVCLLFPRCQDPRPYSTDRFKSILCLMSRVARE